MKNEIRNFYGIISICSLIAAALLGIFWGLSGNIGCAPAVLILGVVFVATLEKSGGLLVSSDMSKPPDFSEVSKFSNKIAL